MHSLTDLFWREDITGFTLMTMTRKDLLSIRVRPLGTRHKLFKALGDLHRRKR